VATDIVLGVAVLALLIWRQLSTRPVNASALRLIVILLAIGLLETGQFLAKNHAGTLTYAAIVGSLLIAAVFGALRAATVRIWLSAGQAWSKGNWLTALLWVAAVVAHLGYDALLAHSHGNRGLGTATIVLYLAISLGFQRIIVQHRANQLVAAAPAG
jgi:UDP-N-acetylmuramyl pentapeptide phosphotransferase/UDP-N-acetylglucosamine-1-phosphate transferase